MRHAAGPARLVAAARRTIGVAVARHPADDPRRRVGTLFFNPGGPGDGGAEYVVAADHVLLAALRSRFDIVGMDPRGIGASTPIRCGVPVFPARADVLPPYRGRSSTGSAPQPRGRRELPAASRHQVGTSDTASVARDHEALRIALGVQQVSWLVLSYGTQIAANYAALYPNRTRAMVLDAALEHSAPEVLLTAEAISTVENAFNRFARWCDTAPRLRAARAGRRPRSTTGSSNAPTATRYRSRGRCAR